MKHLGKKLAGIGLVSILAAAPLTSFASPAEQDASGTSGTIVCGGSHFNRMVNAPSPEGHTTTYVWRNYNQDLSINIDRFTMYDATGAVLFDYDGTNLPLSFNEVLGGTTGNTIEPNQTVHYRTGDLIPPLPKTQRPILVRVDWSAESRALVPEMVWVRNTRRLDHNGPNGSLRERETRARHLNNCRSINLEQGRKEGHRKHHD